MTFIFACIFAKFVTGEVHSHSSPEGDNVGALPQIYPRKARFRTSEVRKLVAGEEIRNLQSTESESLGLAPPLMLCQTPPVTS